MERGAWEVGVVLMESGGWEGGERRQKMTSARDLQEQLQVHCSSVEEYKEEKEEEEEEEVGKEMEKYKPIAST